jgi:hypothetical protein
MIAGIRILLCGLLNGIRVVPRVAPLFELLIAAVGSVLLTLIVGIGPHHTTPPSGPQEPHLTTPNGDTLLGPRLGYEPSASPAEEPAAASMLAP